MGMPDAADQADIILLVGGDGTIHFYLEQLVKLRLPVLVVPAGSGNDLAGALGLCRIHDSLVAWRKFRESPTNVCPIDLGILTPLSEVARQTINCGTSVLQRYFCCVAGVGLDAEVARRANHLPRWLRSHGGYLLSLGSAAFRFAALPMKIFTWIENSHFKEEQWQIRGDQATILAAFANTPSYGGGMKIAPRAKIDDGLLDVCIVGGMDPFKLFCMFPTVYSGRHLDIRGVDYFQAERLRVETEHPLDVYADGEYLCRTPVEIGVAKRALPVVIP
jgi:diacylglycerol kinase (ATP)